MDSGKLVAGASGAAAAAVAAYACFSPGFFIAPAQPVADGSIGTNRTKWP